MTLMKSLLLGSAATFVVVAGAQAADLPTKKGAPAAEYVKVCKIGDIAGFIIPGSDTCLKIGGLVTAQTDLRLDREPVQYHSAQGNISVSKARRTVTRSASTPAVASPLDAVSNTAYGPLLAHINLEGNAGSGFDSNAGSAVHRRRLHPVGWHHRWLP